MENNRLIIDFMGIKPKSVIPNIYYWNDAPFFYISEDTPEKVMDGIVEYSKYHTSWDWLMSVVEKIEKDCKAHVCIWINSCSIEFYGIHDNPPKFDIKAETKIQATYKAVVEFIKWYNNELH